VRGDVAALAVADGALRVGVMRLGRLGEDKPREADVPAACQKVLESRGDHWRG
jgi:hypothetical protein